jgi:signal transduction histidine kinase
MAVVSTFEERLEELQRAVAARDEFIATVAHELRNQIAPLALQIKLALIKAEQIAAEPAPAPIDWMPTALRRIDGRLHRFVDTLDRLLDVSRLSSGRLDLQVEPMSLADVVRDVIDSFDAELAVARCPVSLTERSHAAGVWDRLRVEQVCRNLLSNAIRFGAGRPIEISIDADDDTASLTVTDHGIGIAPDQQVRIFERFEQGLQPRSGGFGIGLWIVRSICLAMGGTVSVESAVGAGACFAVTLPRRPPDPAGAQDRSDSSERAARPA